MRDIFVFILFSLSIVGCRNEVPVVPTPGEEKVEEVVAGVEIIVDGLDQGSGYSPYIGISGSGRPIELNLKGFYPMSEVKANKYRLSFNLSANQYIYVEGLNYYIYDVADPQTCLNKGVIEINKLQLQAGKRVLTPNISIEFPTNLSEGSRYAIRLILLNGGAFSDKRINKSKYNPFDYDFNVPAPNLNVLSVWCPTIEKRLNEAISKYSYMGLKRYGQSYEDLSNIKTNVAEISKYANDFGSSLRARFTQLYKDELDKRDYDYYLKEYNTLISQVGNAARNNVVRCFQGSEDYALSMSLFKTIVLDKNAPERIMELYRVRTQCMTEHASNVVNKVEELCVKMQKLPVSAWRGEWWVTNWPFRYNYKRNEQHIFSWTDNDEILRNWLKVQKELDQYRSNVIKLYNEANAKYDGIGLNWHNTSDGKNFFDIKSKPFLIYNYDIKVD